MPRRVVVVPARRGGKAPVVIFASLMIMGGTPMAWNAITDHNESKPQADVVQYHDYVTPAAPWHPKLPNSPMLGLGQSAASGSVHLHAPHLHIRLHHNRIGGYWSRRAFRGAIRGLFGGW